MQSEYGGIELLSFILHTPSTHSHNPCTHHPAQILSVCLPDGSIVSPSGRSYARHRVATQGASMHLKIYVGAWHCWLLVPCDYIYK